MSTKSSVTTLGCYDALISTQILYRQKLWCRECWKITSGDQIWSLVARPRRLPSKLSSYYDFLSVQHEFRTRSRVENRADCEIWSISSAEFNFWDVKWISSSSPHSDAKPHAASGQVHEVLTFAIRVRADLASFEIQVHIQAQIQKSNSFPSQLRFHIQISVQSHRETPIRYKHRISWCSYWHFWSILTGGSSCCLPLVWECLSFVCVLTTAVKSGFAEHSFANHTDIFLWILSQPSILISQARCGCFNSPPPPPSQSHPPSPPRRLSSAWVVGLRHVELH